MKTKELWDNIFSLKEGDRVRICSDHMSLSSDLVGRYGKITEIKDLWATVEIDHIPHYKNGSHAFWRRKQLVLLSDLKRIRNSKR